MEDKELDLTLEKIKLQIFTFDKFSSFYGSLMCTLDHKWDPTCSTAYTDGEVIGWSKEFFSKLTPTQRLAVEQHEIEHVARLHMIRGEGLNPETWNEACDHVINLDLIERGYDIKSIPGVLCDPAFKKMPEEEVYMALLRKGSKPKNPFGGNDGDIKPGKVTPASVVGKVIQARDMARINNGGKPGSCPGHIEEYLESLLKPKVDWRAALARFITELIPGDRTWARPNRRYMAHNMYMPSQDLEEDKLTHLMYFFDVSGSMTDGQLQQLIAEVKEVRSTLKPERITLCQFDVGIRDTLVIEEHDDFETLKVNGRGGTCLIAVRDLIQQEKPTAAVIFTDMGCDPMEPLTTKTPIFWVVLDNPRAHIPFGEAVFIETD